MLDYTLKRQAVGQSPRGLQREGASVADSDEAQDQVGLPMTIIILSP